MNSDLRNLNASFSGVLDKLDADILSRSFSAKLILPGDNDGLGLDFIPAFDTDLAEEFTEALAEEFTGALSEIFYAASTAALAKNLAMEKLIFCDKWPCHLDLADVDRLEPHQRLGMLEPKFHQQVTQFATQVEQRLKWAVGADTSLLKVLNEYTELHSKCFHRLQSLSSLATALASVSTAILHCESFRTRTPRRLLAEGLRYQLMVDQLTYAEVRLAQYRMNELVSKQSTRVEELHELNPIMRSQLAVHHQLLSDVHSVLKSMAKCSVKWGMDRFLIIWRSIASFRNVVRQYPVVWPLKIIILRNREGRRGDGHIGQGWVLRFKANILNYLTPHLESNTDLQHHTQKRYNYAIDDDVNLHRQLKHKLNCFDLPNPALTCPSPRLPSPLKKNKQKTHYLANRAVKHPALRVFHKCEYLISVQVGLLRLQRLMEKPTSSFARLF
ncbi:hypothetical protein OUZ56_003717 [Daphnia magna]|uniref:Uncharacterized protein n=1 Tax=Daphnia magna TaxID=35525 RepID=A0ABR0A9Y5_9CRUS|nr:hypothetical protein OUZ56_003717 [Daphnia magna]